MAARPRLTVLTGAGISAESGLKTFRDSGGLWENFDVMEVASINGWKADPDKVHRFYDLRRAQAWLAEPNEGHRTLARLEQWFHVDIITQNVDRLHERAGSTRVLHLHGDLHSARSAKNRHVVREIGDQPLPYGELAPDGGIWRPNIVWFGEEVPNMIPAIDLVEQADILIVAGTSLQVYPAAGLIAYARHDAIRWLADPNPGGIPVPAGFSIEQAPASVALPAIARQILPTFGFTDAAL